jgi:hypothetical protein
LRADATDKVESGKASAGTDGGVPNLISLASGAANAVSSIVGLSGRADTAAVADQVVSWLAFASTINPLFVGIAGSDAKSKV